MPVRSGATRHGAARPNGHEDWTWDDTRYPPRRVQAFDKKADALFDGLHALTRAASAA